MNNGLYIGRVVAAMILGLARSATAGLPLCNEAAGAVFLECAFDDSAETALCRDVQRLDPEVFEFSALGRETTVLL